MEDEKEKSQKTIKKARFGRRFGISRQAVEYLIKKKIIKTIKVGKEVVEIPEEEIDRFRKRRMKALGKK